MVGCNECNLRKTATNRQSKYTEKKRPGAESCAHTCGSYAASVSHVPAVWPWKMGTPIEERSENDKNTWNSTKYGLLERLWCIQYRNGVKTAFLKHLKICRVRELDLNGVVTEEVKEPRAGVTVRQMLVSCLGWMSSKSTLITLKGHTVLGFLSFCTWLAECRHYL